MASFFKHIVVGHVWMELVEFEKCFKCLFFVTVGFVHSRWRTTVTDRVYRQIHLTRECSHALHTSLLMCITLHGSSVCMSASFHLHIIHDERLIVCSFLLPRSVFLCISLRLLPLLFHTLLAL